LSRKDYERAVVLRERQAIEEREFLRRQALVEQHLAELRAAEVILHSLGVDEDRLRSISAGLDLSVATEDHSAVEPLLPLRSPLSGVVLTRDAILGDHVEPGQVLFTVSDLTSLWARLDAYEHQIEFLSPDADVVIRAPVLPDREFPGRITFIADQVDRELRTVGVRVEVPNAGGALKPNMYVQGFLRVRTEGEERLVVPADAVQFLEGRSVVFVQGPPEPGEDHLVFEAVEVTPGETLTVGRIILGGLDGTEQIVTVGAFTLKAELTKGAGGHGHAH
jgi:cobalt-zinc-cadmium efflux system membrane fusion protein